MNPLEVLLIDVERRYGAHVRALIGLRTPTVDAIERSRSLLYEAGPTGAILDAGPKVSMDPTTDRAIVFYPANPAYRNGATTQVWTIDHPDGVGGDPVWSQLVVTGDVPTVNGNAAVAYNAKANELYVYGGCAANCSPALSAVSVLKNANGTGGPAVWSTIDATNPQPRSGHEMAYDAKTNSLLTFGGNLAFYGTDFNDTRSLQIAVANPTWTVVPTEGLPPGPRSESFAMAYDDAASRLIVFGGNHLVAVSPYDIEQYNDVQILSHANGVDGIPTWGELEPSGARPGPRAAPAVFDPKRQRLLVFGGSAWSNADQTFTSLADLWELSIVDDGNGAWNQLFPAGDAPPPMAGHAAAFSENGRMIIIAPGDSGSGAPPDLWVLAD